jgi:hypothetical protein
MHILDQREDVQREKVCINIIMREQKTYYEFIS